MAGNDGRRTKAVRKLDPLVVLPELNERQRTQARQMLDVMKRGLASASGSTELPPQEDNQ